MSSLKLEQLFRHRQRLLSKKNPTPELTITLFISLSTPTPKSATKEKGVELGTSLLLVEHICICLLISKTINRKRVSRVRRRGREREGVRADFMSLNRHFMEHGLWATPCLS
jgi:hypothetical protein